MAAVPKPCGRRESPSGNRRAAALLLQLLERHPHWIVEPQRRKGKSPEGAGMTSTAACVKDSAGFAGAELMFTRGWPGSQADSKVTQLGQKAPTARPRPPLGPRRRCRPAPDLGRSANAREPSRRLPDAAGREACAQPPCHREASAELLWGFPSPAQFLRDTKRSIDPVPSQRKRSRQA